MRQAGRYLPEYREVRGRVASFLDLCRTPELSAEVTLQPLRRFDLDAAIVFSDILIVPFAMGQKIEFVEGEGPRLDPIRDGKALASLDAENVESKLAPVYETLERVCARLPRSRAGDRLLWGTRGRLRPIWSKAMGARTRPRRGSLPIATPMGSSV